MPGGLVETQMQRSSVASGICISNKFSGDTDTSGLETPLLEPFLLMFVGFLFCYPLCSVSPFFLALPRGLWDLSSPTRD